MYSILQELGTLSKARFNPTFNLCEIIYVLILKIIIASITTIEREYEHNKN